MSKKVAKTTGRPPVDIESYFTKIEPNLALGFSLHRACKIAQVPYTTVVDYYNADESFRSRIDSLIEDTNLHARSRLAARIKGQAYDGKAIEFWLRNMDEDFKDKPQTQIGIVGNEMSIEFIEGD